MNKKTIPHWVMGFWKLDTTLEPDEDNLRHIAECILNGYLFGTISRITYDKILLPDEKETDGTINN